MCKGSEMGRSMGKGGPVAGGRVEEEAEGALCGKGTRPHRLLKDMVRGLVFSLKSWECYHRVSGGNDMARLRQYSLPVNPEWMTE